MMGQYGFIIEFSFLTCVLYEKNRVFVTGRGAYLMVNTGYYSSMVLSVYSLISYRLYGSGLVGLLAPPGMPFA